MTDKNHFAANINGGDDAPTPDNNDDAAKSAAATGQSPPAETPAGGQPLRFLEMPVKRLALLLFFTAGLHELYWLYRNWVLVRDATGRAISPLLRAIFSIFFIWALFKQIRDTARQTPEAKQFAGGWWALGYIVFSLVLSVVSYVPGYLIWLSLSYAVLLALLVLPFTEAQRTINDLSGRLPAPKRIVHHRSTNETILIVLGVILFVLVVVSYAKPDLLSDPIAIQEQQTRVDDLAAQYGACKLATDTRSQTVDRSSQASVDAYESEVAACERTRLEHQDAIKELEQLQNGI